MDTPPTPMSNPASLSLPFLLLLLLSHLPSTLSTPPPSVSTSSCSRSSSVVNDLHHLPRLNLKAAIISPDLGAYDWYSCTTDAQGNEDCEWFDPFSSMSALYATAPSSTSPINLLQSYGVYIAFAMLCAVISLLLGCGLCIGRYCCCCIRGGTCGKRWPTLKSKCCGLQPNPFTGALEYSGRERWCARGYMALFVVMLVIWILTSYIAGTGSIPSSMKAIAASPSPIISQLQSLAMPARDLIVNLASHTVTDLVTSVNATITSAIDLTALVDDMACIVQGTEPVNLPNATLLLAVIGIMQAQLGGVNATLTSAQNTIAGLEAQVGTISAGVGVVQAEVGQLSADVASFLNGAQAITTRLNTLAIFSTNLTSTTIDSDLAGMPTALPDSSHVSDAQTELTDLAGANTYTFTQTDATQTTLASINASYTTSPDYAHTGDELAELQADVAYLESSNLFGALVTAVGSSQVAVANISADIVATNATLTLVAQSLLQGFNLTAPITLLLTINGSVVAVEGLLTVIDSQLALVSPLLSILPCFFSALDMAVAFNATLLQLPSAFDSVVTLGPTLNSTLISALASVAVVQGQVDAFQSQLANLSISAYLTQLTNMTTLASASASTLLTGPTSSLLASALNSTRSANFTGVSQLVQLNATVHSIPFNASLNAALTELQQLKLSAIQLLSLILPDLQQINTYGFCTVTGTNCTASTDCSSNVCSSNPSSGGSPVTKRCRLSGTTGCTGDVDCTAAGDRCLVDPTRYGYLRGNITLIQALTPPSSQTSTLLTQLDLALAQAAPNASGLSAINTTVASATQAMQAVDLSGTSAALAGVTSSLGVFDASGVLSQVAAVQSALTSVDLTSAQSTVSSLASSLNDVNADLDQLQQAQQLVTSLRDLLYRQMHVYLAEISGPSLLAAYNQGGLTSMATQLLSLVDNATAFLNNSQYIQPTNLTSLLTSDISHYLDALSTSTYSAHGPLYFLGMLADKSKTLDLSLFNEQLTARVDVDRDGVDYPNGTYCLTTACVDASIDYYTTTSLKTVSSGSIPVGISGLQALSVPLVIPAIIALLGVLSMLCVKSTSWASCCSSCTACLIFSVLPFIFIFVGLVWPLVVLAFADGCSGGVSIGNQYVLQESASLCSQLSGNSSGTLCTVSQLNVSFTFDVAAVYESVLGNTCSASNDPLHSTWQQIAQTVSSYPVTKADEAIDNLNTGDSEIRVRPALLNLVYAAANSSGVYFEDAVEEAGSLLGCAALSSTFQQVKGALCCDTATTFYWAIGAWYLIAFSMLLCGWQAALLGRKRFGDQIWGPEVVPLVNPDGFASGQITVQPAIFAPSDEQLAAQQQSADEDAAGQAPGGRYPTSQWSAHTHFPTSIQYSDPAHDIPPPPPGYASAPEPFAPSAYPHYDPHQPPEVADDASIVRGSMQRGVEAAGARTPSQRHSRRPSAIQTGGVSYPVVVHGAEEEDGEGERPSPMVQQHDLAYAGQSEYLSMYPTMARSSSAASDGSSVELSPMPRGLGESQDMRGAHLLAGYPDQSPSPVPDESPVVTDYE